MYRLKNLKKKIPTGTFFIIQFFALIGESDLDNGLFLIALDVRQARVELAIVGSGSHCSIH